MIVPDPKCFDYRDDLAHFCHLGAVVFNTCLNFNAEMAQCSKFEIVGSLTGGKKTFTALDDY